MWLQAKLTVDRTQALLIEQLFDRLGAMAVSLDDAGDEAMFEPPLGETPLWQATQVSGLFDGAVNPNTLRSFISQTLSADLGCRLQLTTVADCDWERAWMEHYEAMQFGDRLWVRPAGWPVAQANAITVDLDPGLAFGTGTHPTTAMCLRWLDKHPPIGDLLIDFGCGSGVLAIAAVKLGAHQAIAVDHDPQAVLAARDNAARNKVLDRIRVLDSQDLVPHAADLVMANILANVLIELAARLCALLRPGGRILLSGILAEQAAAVKQAYASAIDFELDSNDEEWVLLSGTKRD